ncbi:MAG TPA: putative LPS assembly protein LptD [Vicinamibacterales bacterium]|nr:putative LPS assembly protein LptD [Vicinamibacterales bacterium]
MCLWTSSADAQAPTPASPPSDTAPAPVVSGNSSTTSLPLGLSKWSSWKFESEGDHLHLINQAAIEGPNLKFFADDVDLYVNTNKVVASGNVVFTNADGRISAERLEFDTGTGIGTFYDASGIMSLGQQAGTNTAAFGGQEPDVYFYGAKLEKLGPRKYRITRGGFTTCVQPTPRWEVTSGSVVLNLDDYAIARNTLLKVKGVPLMYLPVIYYPIQKSQRQTGFLLPTYGTSTIRGQSLSNAFFWAINRSQDATLFHDWFTRTGTGMGTEYRYIAGLQSAGNVRLYRFNQHETTYAQSGATLPAKTSYEFTGAVTQALGGRARARMRLDYFSDVFTQQIYHQNIYQASRRNRLVEAGASDVFGPLSTTVLYQRNETFDSDTRSVLYGSTPKLSAVLAPQQLFGAPIYASLNSEYAFLPYRNVNDNVVTLDNSLARVDVAPAVRVPLSRLTYLSLNTSAGYRTTYYSRSFDTRGVAVPDSFIRNYAQLRTEVLGPVFTKIWDTPDSGYSERMKHVIEPAFTVDYTTPIDDVRRTPILTDTSDFVVGGTSRMTYGLTNRFLYRGKTVEGVRGQTREFITVGIQQTYYSNPESSKFDTSYSSSNTSRTPVNLSPISLNARVSPSARIDANTRAEYDVHGLGLASLGVGSTVSAGLASGSLQFSRQRLSVNSKPNSYFSGSTSLHTPNGHFTGTYGIGWDLTHSTIVTQNVLATYMAQCCGLQMEFQNFHLVSSAPIPSDRRINVSFVLAGLGTFSNFFGAFGNTLR